MEINSIEHGAFYGCTSLAQITLPTELASIGILAFYGCTNLTLVTCLTTVPPSLGISVFYNIHASLAIKVPAGSVEAYQAAEGWREYADKISAID